MRERHKYLRRRLPPAIEWGAPTDVAVLDKAKPAADRRAAVIHRTAVTVSIGVIVLLGIVGGLANLFVPRVASAPAPVHLDGPTVESRQVDLATSCVRDAANFDPAMPPGAWKDRLAPCFTDTPNLLDQMTPPAGAQVAAEPTAAITHRTADGLTVTIVIRLRMSGSPLPVYGYLSVDVGCRADGACSLTTVPVVVGNLNGDPKP